jgi:superfamily II DNA or RNA helicase
MELRPYQRRLTDAVVAEFRRGSAKELLAACPGAGKTEMALEVIEQLVFTGKAKRVLVLAHGTRVLRTNFHQRLHSQRPHLGHAVRVALPHERRSIVGTYDFVVVDEAHEFYDVEDGMVEEIIQRVRAKMVLLLTGSPSRFIAQGIRPHSFSLEELNAEGKGRWNADVEIELAVSAYKVLEKDWNEYGEVRATLRYTPKQTAKTLDDLLKGLTDRLRTNSSWQDLLAKIKKTIISCRSIEMADQVGTYFRRRGIVCSVSHSINDADSKNIERFKSDSKMSLLVVVDRAQLGFDFDRLANFVDLTGSRNPNRIFQMLCRVVRTPSGEPPWRKLFVKVMPKEFAGTRLRCFMSGVLKLAQKDFFSTWAGGLAAFNSTRIPMRAREASAEHTAGNSDAQKEPYLDNGMMLFGDYFKAVSASAPAYETIAWVRLAETFGRTAADSAGRKSEIKAFYEAHGRMPKVNEPLYGALANYCHRSKGTYDPAFHAWAAQRGYGGRTLLDKESQIKAFYEETRALPLPGDPLYRVLMHLCAPSHHSYSPSFRRWALAHGWIRRKPKPRPVQASAVG